MKLYDTPSAPNPRRVRDLPGRKGDLDPDWDGRARQVRAPRRRLRAAQPVQRLPVLDLDDGAA